MNDTELLKEILGFFYVDSQNNLCWPFNECVDGLRDVCENSSVVDALIKRRSELYGEVNNSN